MTLYIAADLYSSEMLRRKVLHSVHSKPALSQVLFPGRLGMRLP